MAAPRLLHGKTVSVERDTPVPRILRTVAGKVECLQMGPALTHEHVLVDFVGADQVKPRRYDPTQAAETILPHLKAAYLQGFRTLFECTPDFIGRDPELLLHLSELTQLHIVTNTGLYGAANDKFIPDYAWKASDKQLATRWIHEARHGIEETGIRPGFIKSGVDRDPLLSVIDHKLVRASIRTHLETGLPVAIHTGAGPGLQIMKDFEMQGAHPSAFIWVHAQNAEIDKLVQAAERGAWISLDGLRERSADNHLSKCQALKERDHLNQILLSHDAGWVDPENPDRPYRGYAFLHSQFIPKLLQNGFTEKDVHTLLVSNPAQAFGQPA